MDYWIAANTLCYHIAKQRNNVTPVMLRQFFFFVLGLHLWEHKANQTECLIVSSIMWLFYCFITKMRIIMCFVFCFLFLSRVKALRKFQLVIVIPTFPKEVQGVKPYTGCKEPCHRIPRISNKIVSAIWDEGRVHFVSKRLFSTSVLFFWYIH